MTKSRILHSQGVWVDGNRIVSYMWKDLDTDVVFYEDCPEARAKNLPIAPIDALRIGFGLNEELEHER